MRGMAELPADRSSWGRHPFAGLGRNIFLNMSRGLRLLRRTPAFTLTALLTLGLCIGANTAIFSVVDAALFRPLPYPHPERLGLVTTRLTTRGGEESQTGQDGQTWDVVSRNAQLLDCAAFSD